MNARTDMGPGMDEPISQLRIPPHSMEAEQSVLGGLLLDNTGWDRVVDLLTHDDFYRHEHRLVFEAISALANANRPADVLTVHEHLERTGKAGEVGGLAYVAALAQVVPSAANIRRYAEIVRERAVLRRLVAASDEMATAAFNPGARTVQDIVDTAAAAIMGLSEVAKRDDWEDSNTAVVDFIARIQAAHDGSKAADYVPTGIGDLDEKLDGGARPGEVIVIAARPGMGKTALALSIGEHMARLGQSVGVLSMEMPKAQIQRRRVAMESRVPLHKLRRPERMSEFDWSEMSAAVERLRQRPLYVSDKGSLTIHQIRAQARRLRRAHGLRALVVDYIGLTEGTDRKSMRSQQLGEVSRGIKSLAKELGITVFLLAQLNREVEKRPNGRPLLSDLKECGDIEQDADAVVFIHREYVVKPGLSSEWKHYAELIVAKLRDGEPGSVPAQYVGECVRFSTWPTDQPIPTSKVVTKETSL